MRESNALFLGFDYGQLRIGVALGDPLTCSARPLTVVHNKEQPDWPHIQRMVQEWTPQALIVGLPLNEDGSEQKLTAQSRDFAQQLQQRFGLPVHFSDERYSSREADDLLRSARSSGRMPRRLRKGDRDQHAARLILEQWLLHRN